MEVAKHENKKESDISWDVNSLEKMRQIFWLPLWRKEQNAISIPCCKEKLSNNDLIHLEKIVPVSAEICCGWEFWKKNLSVMGYFQMPPLPHPFLQIGRKEELKKPHTVLCFSASAFFAQSSPQQAELKSVFVV